ncbi:MAG: valine--tRNA ligase [Bacillota bacterium]|nr:MAG: valine--tRNA ligase [Planctomycetota bacterium]RUA08161.1 MAG: valine--tRNA ligase [Bacillota bacterium]
MAQELAKNFDPASIERSVYQRWLEAGAFDATPDDRDDRYVIMMPLPNVTGALHMGHALDNVMQDLLTRWHRMQGDNTLWMPGTDHAGIATQAVVEKRLLELEGKTRHDVGRDGLVERIWGWKNQYQKRIISQLQTMGCSCDWKRQRFTMDETCARAVTWTFFRMFDDGLIYQGNRMVNWDCHLQTAVSDDEIEHRSVDGHFWHLRYPVIDPQPGEPETIVVATTRPETMLGDTAVACHPDPSGALEMRIEDAKQRLERAPDKSKQDIEMQIELLNARRQSHLPLLEQFAQMAKDGRMIRLPIVDREIPLITDEWAKPELGSGCVKITPGHDPNDYDVWTRHSDEIDLINILNPDGTLNEHAGPCSGLDRFEARKEVVSRFEAAGLLEEIEARNIEVGHSDRSKTPIEPYLSLQWFVQMGDVDQGVTFGRGTDLEFEGRGLAQAAIDACSGWKSETGRTVNFHPDPERYRKTLVNWLAEKRDWCISRQLWWGHQIPIWSAELEQKPLIDLLENLHIDERDDVRVRFVDGITSRPLALPTDAPEGGGRILVCLRDPSTQGADSELLDRFGFERDPDVLDTWFSSALWPHSTLGWPDPETASVEAGQSRFTEGDRDTLSYYYPGSCLVTGRDIITLWVARMVVMGLYNLGDLPFTDVFLHAIILDGKGERMSKSKGNGIDPVDIIERYGTDAMRYVLSEMQTGTQDIRLPVHAISPFTANSIDLATAKHGRNIFTYICPESGKEFDVLGTMEDVPAAKLISDRFDVGRNFCNKLWNAVRFALMNLEGYQFDPARADQLGMEDRWILSRLSDACQQVQQQLEDYNPSAAIGIAREFFWNELCDWYLEAIKPRLRDGGEDAGTAQQVLATCLDQVLRLLHPFVPFVTEELWGSLREIAELRGIDAPLPDHELLCLARWPAAVSSWRDVALEHTFDRGRELIRTIRDLRSRYNIPPREPLEVRVRTTAESEINLGSLEGLILHLGCISSLTIGHDVERTIDSAVSVSSGVEVFVPGVIDLEKEKVRLREQEKQTEGRLDGSHKKLANENFVSKAAPEVVEREKALVAELEQQLMTIRSNIEALNANS